MNIVKLIEDNAGGLFISADGVRWYDVTPVQDQSTFADDAKALVNGDTADWTVDAYDEEPMGEQVATYNNGRVTVEGRPGIAASNYLRNT